MKSGTKRFFQLLACIIILMAGVTFGIKNIIPHLVSPHWAILILFFSIVSVIVYFATTKVRSGNDIHKFTNFRMITTMAKMLLYLAIILIYSLIFKDEAKSFAVTFLAYYLCFSIFETYILVKK